MAVVTELCMFEPPSVVPRAILLAIDVADNS
jgi:hypothetical protein